MVTFDASRVEAVKAVDAELGIGLPAAENVIDGIKHAMGHGNRGLVAALLRFQADRPRKPVLLAVNL
jgi:hypothetical protein